MDPDPNFEIYELPTSIVHDKSICLSRQDVYPDASGILTDGNDKYLGDKIYNLNECLEKASEDEACGDYVSHSPDPTGVCRCVLKTGANKECTNREVWSGGVYKIGGHTAESESESESG